MLPSNFTLPPPFRVRVHESSVTWFRPLEASPNVPIEDQFFEGATIRGDARNLAFVELGACVDWRVEGTDVTAKFLPAFLTETKRHNAVWLAGLKRKTRVDLFVEKVIHVRAEFFQYDAK